jgi:hypothetical protein
LFVADTKSTPFQSTSLSFFFISNPTIKEFQPSCCPQSQIKRRQLFAFNCADKNVYKGAELLCWSHYSVCSSNNRENRRFYENFNKWTLKYRWKVFFRLPSNKEKRELTRKKGRKKKLQNNIYKMKKACRRYVSITCNEIFIIGWCWKTCICLFEWRKQIFINLICKRKDSNIAGGKCCQRSKRKKMRFHDKNVFNFISFNVPKFLILDNLTSRLGYCNTQSILIIKIFN